jgi:hypothetical protein
MRSFRVSAVPSLLRRSHIANKRMHIAPTVMASVATRVSMYTQSVPAMAASVG